MIEVNIHGDSWDQITQQIAGLIRGVSWSPSQNDPLDADSTDLGKLGEHLADEGTMLRNMESNIDALERQLTAAEEEYRNKAAGYEELLKVKDARIAELEKQLAGAEAGETKKPKKPPIPAKKEDCAQADGEEDGQTDIPEVTEAPAKEIKKEEVRAVLVKCREANIAISEILAPYGGSLGVVKKEDYAKVMADAKAALEGK